MFPKADGARMRSDVAPEDILRRALARAGIVTGYEHVCRRKGCGQVMNAPDANIRRCPDDGWKMWPKAGRSVRRARQGQIAKTRRACGRREPKQLLAAHAPMRRAGNAPRRPSATWFDDLPHTHVVLDDAIEQGALFCNMLRENTGGE